MPPASEPSFAGVVGRTVADSEPWWPDAPWEGRPRRDVVVIVLDDVGFADLGCYGSEIATPNIDALAAGGLRYTEFHTTTLCSPTRACLLTGRNHHAVGMSMVAEWDTGFPNGRSRVTPAAATLAEVLGDDGYATFAVGKWHLAPPAEQTQAGPFHNWPLAKGFDRYYGFLQGYTDQFHPELVQDNTVIDPPARPDDGYHLSEDLADHAVAFVGDHLALTPDRPFFVYLAFGACHWPLQAPTEYLDRYRGRYDVGWDEIRAERFARQRELGVVPDSAALPPHDDLVRPWDDLRDDQRVFAARLQEAYAGFLEHTDAQIGRVIDHLRAAGRLDDTIVVLLSDNGASSEGGPQGILNITRFFNAMPSDIDQARDRLDEIGGPTVQVAYPAGWAEASNTPVRRYKGTTHGGGVRDPLIVHWPGGIADGGGIRRQFHHVIDVFPTIAEVVGVEVPTIHRGVEQMPVHGTSLAYTFADPDARGRRRRQHFEMAGHRAIWVDGWKAVTFHPASSSFDDDRWELYHVAEDFSELDDLAAEEPERLEQLVAAWWEEAERYGVLPLDDRVVERVAHLGPPWSPRRRTSFSFPGAAARIPAVGVPAVVNRSFEIRAVVDRSSPDDGGVLVAHGGVGGGYALYVQDARLVYEYDHAGERTRLVSDAEVPLGTSVLSLRFERTGTLTGTARLAIDGTSAGETTVRRTLGLMPSTRGFQVGRDTQSPASPNYDAPFPFSGRLHRVEVDLDDDAGPVTIHDLLAGD